MLFNGENSQQSCILMQYRAEKGKESIPQYFCIEDLPAYMTENVQTHWSSGCLENYFQERNIHNLSFVEYATLNVTVLFKKYSNKESELFNMNLNLSI